MSRGGVPGPAQIAAEIAPQIAVAPPERGELWAQTGPQRVFR